MPRDAAGTHRRIRDSALQLLRVSGIDAFSVEAVARGAGVAKGLVIYHFGSRAELLRECGAALEADRAGRFTRARASAPGVRGIDACWEELRRQTTDGTTRAWLGLLGGGATASPVETSAGGIATRALLDGCAVALAAGVAEASVREAHDALWLGLLQTLDEEED